MWNLPIKMLAQNFLKHCMGQIKHVCGQIQPAGCQFEISGKLWRKKERSKIFPWLSLHQLVIHSLGDHCGSLVKGGSKMLWRFQFGPKGNTTFLPYFFQWILHTHTHTHTHTNTFYFSTDPRLQIWSTSIMGLRDILLVCTKKMVIH